MAEVTPTVSIAGKLTKADAKKIIEEAGGRPFALVAPAVTEIEGWDGTTFKDTSAFNGCKNLVSVSLPAATSIGKHAFENCAGLTSISLPVATEIGEQAFSMNYSLARISVPAATHLVNSPLIRL